MAYIKQAVAVQGWERELLRQVRMIFPPFVIAKLHCIIYGIHHGQYSVSGASCHDWQSVQQRIAREVYCYGLIDLHYACAATLPSVNATMHSYYVVYLSYSHDFIVTVTVKMGC